MPNWKLRPTDKYTHRRRLEIAARKLAAKCRPAPEPQPKPRKPNRAQNLRVRAAQAILEAMDDLRPVNPIIRRDDLWTHLQDAELLRLVAAGLPIIEVAERLRPMRVVSPKSAETRLARLIRLYA
jgi:hypothetical protein